ncbi:MAG: ribosome-associated translation inhibitor RaiA [Chloroflexota bacterium]|nr:ribosome-associated translation inhibitor RaiA [Chloroflexota bacterium]
MQIIIKGKLEVTPRLRQHVEQKAQKLSRLVTPETRVEVTVTEEQTRSAQDRFSVQLVLSGNSHPVRSEVNAPRADKAFDLALDKVIAQLGRQKDRQTSAVRHRTAPVRVLALSRSGALSTVAEHTEEEADADGATDGDYEIPHRIADEHNENVWSGITEIRSVPTKPMGDQEAILQMEALGLSFYPFINEATDTVNVMYRMEKGGYGLLVPSLE